LTELSPLYLRVHDSIVAFQNAEGKIRKIRWEVDIMSDVKSPEGFPEFKLPPKRFFEDTRWVNENINELVKKYPDQWIAVYDKEVVAAGDNLAKVERIAAEKEGNGQCVYSFIEGYPRFYWQIAFGG